MKQLHPYSISYHSAATHDDASGFRKRMEERRMEVQPMKVHTTPETINEPRQPLRLLGRGAGQ